MGEPGAERIKLENDKETTITGSEDTTVTRSEDASLTIDEDGDLRLRVGSAPKRVVAFVVCSKTMGRVSPVFKRMLFGNFAEARTAEEEWVVELPEDHPVTFQIYLDIAHSWFDKVPNKLSVRRLGSLLALADKYDSTALLRPWAQKWLEGVAEARENIWSLSFGWVLGDAKLFRSMVELLVTDSTVDNNGRLQYSGKDIPEMVAHLSPQDIFGRLALSDCRGLIELTCAVGY